MMGAPLLILIDVWIGLESRKQAYNDTYFEGKCKINIKFAVVVFISKLAPTKEAV